MTSRIVHLVADFGGKQRNAGDLAFSEVEGRLLLTAGIMKVTRTAVEAFNVMEAAFVAAQLGLSAPEGEGFRVIVLVNVDPRSHTSEPVSNGDGAPCYLGTLTNSVRIIGPGLGIFGIAKLLGILTSLEHIDTTPFSKGEPGQFRSRDIYPKVIAKLLSETPPRLESVGLSPVPGVGHCVGYIDSFGNIKTTIRQRECVAPIVTVLIGNIMRTMRVTQGLFDANVGEIHLYHRGSSGLKDNRFMEIGIRGGSAAETFPEAAPGSPIGFTQHLKHREPETTTVAPIAAAAEIGATS